MDYNHISNFFNKFKNIVFQKEEIREHIRNIISKNISYEITNDLFDFKNGIIFLKCSPVLRSEIYIKKKHILEDLKNVLPENIKFLDIR